MVCNNKNIFSRSVVAISAMALACSLAKAQDAKGRPGTEMLNYVKSVVAKHTK